MGVEFNFKGLVKNHSIVDNTRFNLNSLPNDIYCTCPMTCRKRNNYYNQRCT